MEDPRKRVDDPQTLRDAATGPIAEAVALGLSLTPEEIAQLTDTLDPEIRALLGLC